MVLCHEGYIVGIAMGSRDMGLTVLQTVDY
jgi:hypothetical protein